MNIQHVLSVIFACLEILFGSLVVGFPFLVFVLQDEGYFSDLCSETDVTTLPTDVNNATDSFTRDVNSSFTTQMSSQAYPTCNKQAETFSFVYSILIVVLTVGIFFNGFIVRKFGTWISKMIGISFYLAGCLILATSSNSNSWAIYLAPSLLTVGSTFFYLCSVQYGNLFPKIKSTLISIFTGTFISSTIMCWLVLLAHRSGISFRHSFYLLSSWSAISFAATFFLSPKKLIPSSADQNYRYGIQERCRNPQCENEPRTVNTNTSDNDNDNPSFKKILLSMWKCIKTKFYITTTLHIWILNFRNLFFISTFPTWILKFGNEDELTSYIDAFAIFALLSGFSSPVIGATADALINRYRKQNIPEEVSKLKAFMICGCLVSGVALIFTISIAIPILPLQYFSFFCYMLMRSSIYSYTAICLTGKFPINLFGVLFGALDMVNGVITLLIKPLLSWVLNDLDGNFIYVEVMFLCLILISFLHPLSLCLDYRSKLKQIAKSTVIKNHQVDE